MKFKIGHEYRTRNGSIAKIVATRHDSISYIVWVLINGSVERYDHEGKPYKGNDNGLDIISEVTSSPA